MAWFSITLDLVHKRLIFRHVKKCSHREPTEKLLGFPSSDQINYIATQSMPKIFNKCQTA